MTAQRSKEFAEREALILLQKEVDQEKHDRKMVELNFLRESERIHDEHEMERGRIKSAEIRKMQERKEASRYYGN